ncbi:MAG TPA: glycosyltransferase family 4 protein [Ramlibacter sp.]|uniref:glycosyltransferase family 4 protein n=1 Tax=Ramlibacter sp. TaxID=1917967 RepID=UPI002D80A19E|nr:glycosyltransferase family 4 protein [Ramlibacter sp.]HET8748152.1 glycosyltransferase family 4 protein [Ramlibacter sp.]
MAAERPLRVLMTADTVGGVWTYAVELARALAARGIEVAVATMGALPSAHQRQELAGVAGVQLFASACKLEWMQDCWPDVDAAGQWLLALEREFAPDLVHLNQFDFGALPFRAPTLLVAHSCVLSWWRAVHGTAAPAEWCTYRTRVTQGLAGAALVAAPTRAMLGTLAENYGVDTARGLVLPNAADPALFAPAAKAHFVLAAGRFWDAAKNLAALEQVAPALPWPVKVAGAAQHPDGGTVHAQHVQCLGELPRAQLARTLSEAAVYALPARYEPFGLSVLEAALSGCALVLGDIASLRETWGEAALYVPPDDPAALQRALLRLMEGEPERARLAAAARSRASHFSPVRQCEAYLQAYARLAPRFATAAPEELACA